MAWTEWKKFSGITLIGTYTASGSDVVTLTFDLSNYEKYKELELNENMLVCVKSFGHTSNAAVNQAFEFSYNNSNGILTVSHSGMYVMTIDVYSY